MGKIILAVLLAALIAAVVFYQKQVSPVDSKQMIESGVSLAKRERKLAVEEEAILRVQLAIVDYLAKKGTPPVSLSELVPAYFDSVPKDPRTNAPYEYRREGAAYRLGGQASAEQRKLAVSAPLEVDFVNPNDIVMETSIYDASGKRDPFEPFDFSAKSNTNLAVGPLERYGLGQLRLAAVVMDPRGGVTAIVEDAAGKGFTVRPGMKMGDKGGVVISIEPEPKPGRLKVLEIDVDITGKQSERVVEMKIQPKVEAQNPKSKNPKKPRK